MDGLIFETARLAVRKATEADTDLFEALWRDPRVMRHVGFPYGLPITRAEIAAQLARQAAQDGEFDCRLVALLRATGAPIGECKLGAPDAQGIAHTDVKLLPQFWGHRYGVEVKRGLLDYLFRHTDCTAVSATPNVNNVASIKMQAAVGGVPVSEGVVEFPAALRDTTTPVRHIVYHVSRAAWEKQQARPEN